MDVKAYPTIKGSIILGLMYWGIALGLGIIVGIVIGIADVTKIESAQILYSILTILSELISYGVVIYLGFIKTKQKFNDVFKFNYIPSELWKAITVFMIGFVILLSELDNIFNYVIPPPEFITSVLETMAADQWFILSMLTIAIIPAITEEMLFRGIILNGLKNNYSERTAIIVSALLFALWHLNPWQFVPAFIIGLISAFICLRTGSLLLCIYIHLFNNALFVIIIRNKDIFTINGINTIHSIGTFQPIWLDISGIIIIVLGIILLAKGIKNFNETKNEDDYFIRSGNRWE
jgi:membrane protease YdiL (CAAX protease family)